MAFLWVHVLFPYGAEGSFWEERRRAVDDRRGSGALRLASLAGLPAHEFVGSPSPLSLRTKSLFLDFTVEGKAEGPVGTLIAGIPVEAGTVRGIEVPAGGKSSRYVLHIQDVHGNQDAQRRIGQVVQSVALRGAGLVALEGTDRPIELRRFRDFPDHASVKLAADYLLRENTISGPVFAALTGPAELPPFQGVEDPALYAENVEAYRRATLTTKALRTRLEKERSLLNRRKQSFSSPLRALDDAVQRHRAGESTLVEYLAAITRNVPAERLAPSVRSFQKAVALENSIDFKEAERQRVQQLDRLTSRLNDREIAALIAWGTRLRLGEISPADFHRRLRNLCRAAKIPLSDYPVLDAYIEYVLLADAVSVEDIFGRVAELEQDAYQRLATPEERRLVEKDRVLHLAGKLLDFSLTPQEWRDYQDHPWPGLSDQEVFYRAADARDEAMAKNLLAAMERAGVQSSILVTGGYHSPGIARRLTDAETTVIRFTPRIDRLDREEHAAHLSSFTQAKTPLDRLFEGEKLFLSKDPAPARMPTKAALLSAGAGIAAGNAEGGKAFSLLAPESPLKIESARMVAPHSARIRARAFGKAISLTVRVVEDRLQVALTAQEQHGPFTSAAWKDKIFQVRESAMKFWETSLGPQTFVSAALLLLGLAWGLGDPGIMVVFPSLDGHDFIFPVLGMVMGGGSISSKDVRHDVLDLLDDLIQSETIGDAELNKLNGAIETFELNYTKDGTEWRIIKFERLGKGLLKVVIQKKGSVQTESRFFAVMIEILNGVSVSLRNYNVTDTPAAPISSEKPAPPPASLPLESKSKLPAKGLTRPSRPAQTRPSASRLPYGAAPSFSDEGKAVDLLRLLAQNPARPLSVPDVLALWIYFQQNFQIELVVKWDKISGLIPSDGSVIEEPREMQSILRELARRPGQSQKAPPAERPSSDESPWKDQAALELLQNLALSPEMALSELDVNFLYLYCRARFRTLLIFSNNKIVLIISPGGGVVEHENQMRDIFNSLALQLAERIVDSSAMENETKSAAPVPVKPEGERSVTLQSLSKWGRSQRGKLQHSDETSPVGEEPSPGQTSIEKVQKDSGKINPEKNSTLEELASRHRKHRNLKKPKEPNSLLHLLTRDPRWGGLGFFLEAAGLGWLAGESIPLFGMGVLGLALAHAVVSPGPQAALREFPLRILVLGLYGLIPFSWAATVHGLYDVWAVHQERKIVRESALWVAKAVQGTENGSSPPALDTALVRHLFPKAESFELSLLDSRGIGRTPFRARDLFYAELRNTLGQDPDSRRVAAALSALATGRPVEQNALPVHMNFVGEEDIAVARAMATTVRSLPRSAEGGPALNLFLVAGSEAVFREMEPLAREGIVFVIQGGQDGSVDLARVERAFLETVRDTAVTLTVSQSKSLLLLGNPSEGGLLAQALAALKQMPLEPAHFESLLRAVKALATSA